LSEADTPGHSQVYVADAVRSTARPLKHLKGELGLPRFSPDGRTIAFLFTENARAAAGPSPPSSPRPTSESAWTSSG